MTVREAKEGHLGNQGVSPTASTAWDRKFPDSGPQKHLVILGMQGGPRKSVMVEATTGDEAANKALQGNEGWKVAWVGPATGFDGKRLSDPE